MQEEWYPTHLLESQETLDDRDRSSSESRDRIVPLRKWKSEQFGQEPFSSPLKKWKEVHLMHVQKRMDCLDLHEEEEEPKRPRNASTEAILESQETIHEEEEEEEEPKKGFLREFLIKTKQSLQKESRIPRLVKSYSTPNSLPPLEEESPLFEDEEEDEFDEQERQAIKLFQKKYKVCFLLTRSSSRLVRVDILQYGLLNVNKIVRMSLSNSFMPPMCGIGTKNPPPRESPLKSG
jgi:hypothetical protein